MAATEAKNKVTLDAIKKKGTAHYLFGILKIMPEKSKENTIQRLENVFESLIANLMDTGKSKDGLKS